MWQSPTDDAKDNKVIDKLNKFVYANKSKDLKIENLKYLEL